MTHTQNEHESEHHLCRLNLLQLRMVEEFASYIPAKSDVKIANTLVAGNPEQDAQHEFIIYGKAHQSPPLWRPLRHNGKAVILTGANITLVAANEKYPVTDMDMPDWTSFRNQEICVAIPRHIHADIANCLKEKHVAEVELLIRVHIEKIEERVLLIFSFQKMWIRKSFVYPQIRTNKYYVLFLVVIILILLIHR